jgi:heme-degrading monooxygenase HmoA
MAPPSTARLAQVNIARLRAPIDSPQTAEFVARLAPVNALADDAPGFLWRLQTEDGDATAVRAFGDDRIIVNMSVWESLEQLAAFVYRSGHVEVMRRRQQWFERMAESWLALWWIPAATLPTVAHAEARLAHLRRHGPTPEAFTFRVNFLPPTSPRPRSFPSSVQGDREGGAVGSDLWSCPAG